MSIYDIRTVSTPTVMPPKPAPVTPAPRMSYAEDAAMIRQRFQRMTGHKPRTSDANAARVKTAHDRDAAAIPLIVEHITKNGPTGCGELAFAFAISDDTMRRILYVMRDKGMVYLPKGKRGWRIA